MCREKKKLIRRKHNKKQPKLESQKLQGTLEALVCRYFSKIFQQDQLHKRLELGELRSTTLGFFFFAPACVFCFLRQLVEWRTKVGVFFRAQAFWIIWSPAFISVWPSALIVFSPERWQIRTSPAFYFIFCFFSFLLVFGSFTKWQMKEKTKCHLSNSRTTLFEQLIIQTVTFCQVSQSATALAVTLLTFTDRYFTQKVSTFQTARLCVG